MNFRAKVLVTGANGQLGQELQRLCSDLKLDNFAFYTSNNWDITDFGKSRLIISEHTPTVLINLAAYTKVDQAEVEKDLCYLVNRDAASNLSSLCAEFNAKLIHISTDYVFHSVLDEAISPNAIKNPKGIYAKSKSEAENQILRNHPDSIIIRSSWIYSEFGNNFVKTMLRLSKSNSKISVVDDQIGSPTYAYDLALVLLRLVKGISEKRYSEISGVFHYANKGQTSWFHFAKKIFEFCNKAITIEPISTKQFNALAPRPPFSVLDCSQTEAALNIDIPFWQDSLKNCLQRLNCKV